MARNKADTFSSGKTVKDHYTGETLTSNQREAVEQYGTDWQNHASETDHINSVDEMYQDHKDDIWLGRDDLKKVINSDKNFQQLSKSNNAAKKNLSPKEYADKLYEDGKISKRKSDRSQGMPKNPGMILNGILRLEKLRTLQVPFMMQVAMQLCNQQERLH